MQYGMITAGVIVALGTQSMPLYAAEEGVIGTPEAREACRVALGFSVDLAKKGTYSKRVDICVEQNIQAEFTKDRTQRLLKRTEKVQERLTRNSRARVYRPIAEPETPAAQFDRFQQLYDAQSTYRKLEGNRSSTRESLSQRVQRKSTTGYELFVPEISPSVFLRKATSERLSRRLIQMNAQDPQTKASRIEAADEYQDALMQAINECSHLANNFHRSNCVRSAQRRIGSW